MVQYMIMILLALRWILSTESWCGYVDILSVSPSSEQKGYSQKSFIFLQK